MDNEISLEEQKLRRQSAPRPTAADYVAQSAPEQMVAQSEPVKAIDKEAVQEAMKILQKYKAGKANLEQRIINNEQWYKMRHWDSMKHSSSDVLPTSGWLFNCIANKHADAMDNFPSPNILPREETDQAEADILTSVLPVVLDQCEFEQAYSDAWDAKLKSGTGAYGIFWDGNKMNGLGDIDIRHIDLLNLFWEPGIKDIQRSRNIFSVELQDNELLVGQYPQLQGKLGTATTNISQYIYDDTVDTSDKSAVINWYYKKDSLLHLCIFVNDEVLFATENDPQNYPNGWYEHGQYPFVFDPLFRVEGTPCGFGYIDVGKSAQEYIDRGNQAIIQNMLANARPRHFIRTDGAVNEKEYADMSKDFIHVDGNLGQDSILPVQGKPLSDIYVGIINNKIDELKETTGNRDISTGGSTSGVTAASAIAAMQEAGSKLSRDHIKASYRAFRAVCVQIIELVRQFYDVPRFFRILGQNGAAKFIQFSNAGLLPQYQGVEMGVDMGYRLPLFDIEITAQKQSPYSKMAQNELALQFYGAGFFNPQMADQALACLEMMDFDRKDFIMQKIAQNGMMYQMAMAQMQAMAPAPMAGGAHSAEGYEALGDENVGESNITKNARQRVAESTSPT